MNNARRILERLDGLLTAPVDFTVFGRAAFQLGFASPPAEYLRSRDVDGVLWIGQAEQLLAETNFWDALEHLNRELAPEGLYLSHLFDENQVILSPEWRTQRQPIAGAWQRLTPSRLGDGDLFLSKLMRYDPLDIEDALFVAARAGWNRDDLLRWMGRARIPDVPEVREQFALSSKAVLDALP